MLVKSVRLDYFHVWNHHLVYHLLPGSLTVSPLKICYPSISFQERSAVSFRLQGTYCYRVFRQALRGDHIIHPPLTTRSAPKDSSLLEEGNMMDDRRRDNSVLSWCFCFSFVSKTSLQPLFCHALLRTFVLSWMKAGCSRRGVNTPKGFTIWSPRISGT